MRILAVDPGEKRIGIAISDPTGTIASPLRVIEHESLMINAAVIAQLAIEHQAEMIIIGQSIDDDGTPTREGRRAARLANAIRQQCNLPVVLWDESFSTQEARAARIALNVRRRKRREPVDELAATVILQSYLDTQKKA